MNTILVECPKCHRTLQLDEFGYFPFHFIKSATRVVPSDGNHVCDGSYTLPNEVSR